MGTRAVPILVLLSAVVAWAPLGCERQASGPGDAPVEAAPPPAEGFAGSWSVKGITQDLTRGDSRRIEGMIVLSEKEGLYNGKSDLRTKFPSEGGAVDADVIGTATGRLDGNVLGGTAETQLVLGTVPGVETEFAFIPRQVGPRITSDWTAHFRRDGTLVVQLENQPAPGEATYRPTRTTLYGTRTE